MGESAMLVRYALLSALVASLLAVSQPALSTTWNYVGVGNDETTFFFDKDTVVKVGDTVTIWMKTVQTRNVDADGSWASAYRWRIGCAKRTVQTMTMWWSNLKRHNDRFSNLNGGRSEQAKIPKNV